MEYQLYCFAQSGNAYRAALMLNLIGADWQPVYVDFFKGGETRTAKYRAEVNEMGEVPVLVHGAKKLSQFAVILTYLAERTGRFKPQGEDARLEALRWIIFDNQKVNGFLGVYRFLKISRGRRAIRPYWRLLEAASTAISRSSTSGFRRRPSFSATNRQSPTFRLSPTCTIRPRNSASTSRRNTKISALGSAAYARCRVGRIPMI
jgi:glutathione S-transferase